MVTGGSLGKPWGVMKTTPGPVWLSVEGSLGGLSLEADIGECSHGMFLD